MGNKVLQYYVIECHSILCKYCHWWSNEIGGRMRLKLTAKSYYMAHCTWWPLTFDPNPGDGIPATLHVILLDKKCFFLWHFWYIACLAFIKLFNLTRTSTTVDYVTQQRTFNGEHLNERFYDATYLCFFLTPKHIFFIFFYTKWKCISYAQVLRPK